MKKPSSKFDLAARLSQPPAEAPANAVDALLFAPANSSTASIAPEKEPAAINSAATAKTRFTNILPTATYVQLHQLAFWDRCDMSAIIDAALQEYFATRPDSAKPLPEQERAKRKLPPG